MKNCIELVDVEAKAKLIRQSCLFLFEVDQFYDLDY